MHKLLVTYLVLILCLFSNALYCQNSNDTLYIAFDKQKDTCWVSNRIMQFSLKDHYKLPVCSIHQLNNFRFDPKVNSKNVVSYNQVKHKLVNGPEAVNKVEKVLARNKNRFKTPLYYNSYFEKIYIVEVDNDTATLYEVKWNWATP